MRAEVLRAEERGLLDPTPEAEEPRHSRRRGCVALGVFGLIASGAILVGAVVNNSQGPSQGPPAASALRASGVSTDARGGPHIVFIMVS